MDYLLTCACGKQVTVNEAAAGSTVPCVCGRGIDVPTWRELKRLSGEPAPPLSPDAVLEAMLGAGKVPFDPRCVRCGGETDERIEVIAECERVQVSSDRWSTLFLFLLVGWPAFLLRRERKAVGKDKVYWLPLPVCPACRPHVQEEADLKRGMRKVDLYRDLLGKYPKAGVRLAR